MLDMTQLRRGRAAYEKPGKVSKHHCLVLSHICPFSRVSSAPIPRGAKTLPCMLSFFVPSNVCSIEATVMCVMAEARAWKSEDVSPTIGIHQRCYDIGQESYTFSSFIDSVKIL